MPEDAYSGDSHLAIAPPATNIESDGYRIETRVDDHMVIASGRPNIRGYLGKLVVRDLPFQDAYAAETAALRAMLPALSYISFRADIPMLPWQIDTVDQVTGSRTIRYTTPHREIALANPGEDFAAERAVLGSLYREALNASSPFYQFLCFYKILERIATRRRERAVSARAAGLSPSQVPLHFPATYDEVQLWLRDVYPGNYAWTERAARDLVREECLGRKVSWIVEQLRPIRKNIAHALMTEGISTFFFDDRATLDGITNWLPTLRTAVRFAVNSEFG
jgi:hypothetical protein